MRDGRRHANAAKVPAAAGDVAVASAQPGALPGTDNARSTQGADALDCGDPPRDYRVPPCDRCGPPCGHRWPESQHLPPYERWWRDSRAAARGVTRDRLAATRARAAAARPWSQERSDDMPWAVIAPSV